MDDLCSGCVNGACSANNACSADGAARFEGDPLAGVVERFLLASDGFGQRLREVRADQWAGPTPCTEWDVRRLVNHNARGNLNYAALARGGTVEEFARMRDADALGDDPVGAYERSVRECSYAFCGPGVLENPIAYRLGPATGAKALAVRTIDAVIHTWDLARALGADETLDPDLVAWIDGGMETIYADLIETPVSAELTYRFFAPPPDGPAEESPQNRLLRRMGRDPGPAT